MTRTEAELYALVHDGAPGDVEFYRGRTRGAARVLELGCGWGRVAGSLECEHVIGLEADPGMRALARSLHPELEIIEGDMSTFCLGSFDRIVVPFTGLYCLTSEEALLGCLRRVRAGLAPGGRFIFDAYAADTFHEEARPADYPADRLEEVARITHSGEPLVVYERSRWDREAQRLDAIYRYVGPDGRERAELTIEHRYVLAPQLDRLLARAGLRLLERRGSFEGAPFTGSASMVVVATSA